MRDVQSDATLEPTLVLFFKLYHYQSAPLLDTRLFAGILSRSVGHGESAPSRKRISGRSLNDL